MYKINQVSLNQWLVGESLLDIFTGITIGGFALCENWGVTFQYNNTSYSNKYYDNEYLDWQRLISHLIKDKTINVDFVLKADSNNELQVLIDSLKSSLSWQKTWWVIVMTIPVWSEIRAIKVVTDRVEFDNNGINGKVQSGRFTLVAVDPPKLYSIVPTTKGYSGITTPFTGQINNLWTSITYPVYYLFFKSATSVTDLSITVNWYETSVSTTITTWDIIILSADIYGLISPAWAYKNNIEIDFDWQITTEITNGSNNIAFTCNGTYEVDISIVYHTMRE